MGLELEDLISAAERQGWVVDPTKSGFMFRPADPSQTPYAVAAPEGNPVSIWHVSIEVADDAPVPDPAALDHFLGLLGPDAAVTGTPEESVDGKARYGADLVVEHRDGGDVHRAVHEALDRFTTLASKAGLPAWPLARLVILSEDELDAELGQPTFPELVGVSEIAGLLGVTRQRASTLARSESFPAPAARLESGPVWTLPSVRRFVESWVRKPGRPARAG